MQVHEAQSDLAAHGIGVVGIGFSPRDRLEELRAELGVGFPLLSDPARRWYQAFEVPRGTWRTIFAPRVLRRYLAALLRRERIPLPREDLRQLGGGILLHGRTVVARWVTDESERRPSIAEVVEATR